MSTPTDKKTRRARRRIIGVTVKMRGRKKESPKKMNDDDEDVFAKKSRLILHPPKPPK